MTNEVINSSPTQAPPAETTQLEQHRQATSQNLEVAPPLTDPVAESHRLRRFGAAVALMGTLVTASACERPTEAPKPSVTHSVTAKANFAPAVNDAGIAAAGTDLGSALEKDDCTTRVTLDEAMTVYKQLFGTEVTTATSLTDLTQLTSQETSALAQAKETAGLVALPEGFAALQQDAESGADQLDITQYQEMLTSYLQQFGVETLFDFKPSDIGAMTMEGFKSFMKPVSHDQLAASKVSRKLMVAVMKNFASLPRSVVENAPLKRIAFGNITDQSEALGQNIDDTVMFDVMGLGQDSTQVATDSEMAAVADHEFSHVVTIQLCRPLFGPYTDSAYESLNKGMPLGPATYKNLLTTGHEGSFVSLDSGDSGTAVVARPYGASNILEEGATTIGETLFYNQDTVQLFRDGVDSQSLQEQIALTVARMAKTNPEVADYFAAIVGAARVQAAIAKQISIKNTEIDTVMQQTSTTTNVDPTQQINTIIDSIKPFQALYDSLTISMTDTPPLQ